jgi:HEAT repeat protein
MHVMVALPSARIVNLPLVAVLAVGTAWSMEDEQPRGMDVGRAVEQVSRWIGPGKPPADKPWANDLADLTESDPARHGVAIARLADHGRRSERVLLDLEALAGDRDPILRSRVAQVLGAIGSTGAAPLLVKLTADRDRLVREHATLSLGRCQTPTATVRLTALLGDPDPLIRQAAAAGLAYLRPVTALVPLINALSDGDDIARRSMLNALDAISNQPAAVPILAQALLERRGALRDQLLELAARLPDRRLCPVLVSIAADPSRGLELTAANPAQATAWTRYLALTALTRSGDSRALETLCHLANGEQPPQVGDAAANAARAIGGYAARPGAAWDVWWKDHQQVVAGRIPFDTFIATIHDPTVLPDRAQIAVWDTAMLMVLVDALLEVESDRLAEWFPANAFAWLRADDPGRWSPALAERAINLPEAATREREVLILLIEDLGGPGKDAALRQILEDIDRRAGQPRGERVRPVDHRAARALIAAALPK